MLSRLRALFIVLVIAVAPASSWAQIGGGNTDIIVGRVTTPDHKPLAGARVTAKSIELQTSRSKTTDANGRYTILFPDGGGQYQVTVTFLGMAPGTTTIARVADEDRLQADFTMSPVATVLDAITIRPDLQAGRNAPTPGEVGLSLTSEQLMRLPVDITDPTALALLMPGVIGFAGSDTSASAFSVAGQRTDQNSITLDGLSFGGSGSIAPEAVRSTRVITNTFDVSRGQFTGGQVASTTRGGTNVFTGSWGYQLRDPSLEFAGDPNVPVSLGSQYTQHTLSGYMGGAFIKDKAFWMISPLIRRHISPLQALTQIDPTTLQRQGVSPDSVQKFLQLVQQYGQPLTVPGLPDQQIQDNASVIARFDYHLNDDHSLMIRPNWTGSLQGETPNNWSSLIAHSGRNHTDAAGIAASLTSQIGGNFLNEVRATYSRNNNDADPYTDSPEGRVRVSSYLPDGTLGVNSLSFGGNSGLPRTGASTALETTDELSWLSSDGAHRYKLGGLLNIGTSRSASSSNQFGSYSYNSLADFLNNTPASYTRTLTPRNRSSGALNAAVYLGDVWRQSRAFQLTYGGRVEGTDYYDTPQFNPAVDSAFGFRTDKFPREVHFSPRAGFTWTVGANDQQNNGRGRGGQPGDTATAARGGAGGAGGGGGRAGGGGGGRGGGGGPGGGGGGTPGFTIISGGIGEFRGRAPTSIFQSAVDATGLPGSQQTLNCVGPAVPIPNWTDYYANPLDVPTACVGGTGPSVFSSSNPNVTVIDPNFQTPRAWRASLSASRTWTRVGSIINRYGLNFNYGYSLSVAQYGAVDKNLNAVSQFTIPNEANRPVYVPASAIVPISGATNITASRANPNYAQVFEAISQLKGRTNQLTVGLTANTSFGLNGSINYTHNDSRDQTGFSAGGLTGAGGRGTVGADNPNLLAWGTSDNQRAHIIVGSVSWIVTQTFDLSSTIQITSGAPYTPVVSGDVNGDGSRNDRAFIFNPATTPDTSIANGIHQLLTTGTPGIQKCLQSQLGQIATRNSCWTGWTPNLNFQANLRPWLGSTFQRRLTFNITAINPLAGIDQLVNGADNLKGWGQQPRSDGTLLYIRGFDPVTNTYKYQVNTRFGDNVAVRTAFRQPFQVALQAHWQIGPDRQREMLIAALNTLNGGTPGGPGGFGGPGGAGGGRGGGPTINFRFLMDRIAPDPIQGMIDMKDTLKLTSEQIDKLHVIGDTLHNRNEALIKTLEAEAEKAAAGQIDPYIVLNAQQPTLLKAQQNYLDALMAAKGVMTPAQWAMLPATIQNPPQMNQGRGGRGGRGGAPTPPGATPPPATPPTPPPPTRPPPPAHR